MFRKSCITIGLLGYCFISEGQAFRADSFVLQWQYLKLRNGIRAILQPDQKAKEVSVEFWVGAGSRDEEYGKFGFAHFFEHATPYGLTEDTSLLKTFRSARTNSNAQTRKDYTRYYVQVKPETLPLALKYTSERLKADTAAITGEIIDMHKKNVLNEINRQESNPFYSAVAVNTRDAGTFGKNNPYGHSGYGTVDENKLFTAPDVRQWYEHYFFPANIILFLSGNFDIEKTKELVKKEFGDIHKKGNRINTRQMSPHTDNAKATIPLPSKYNCLTITWAIAAWGSKDDPALQLIAEILDARLNDLSPFPYSIQKQGSVDLFNLYQWAGQFGVFANFSLLTDSAEIEKYLHKTVAALINKKISEEELSNAKKRMNEKVKAMLEKLGFIGSRTELLGEGLLFANDPAFYLKRLKKQNQLTTTDIQRIALRWLNNDGFRLLSVAKENQP